MTFKYKQGFYQLLIHHSLTGQKAALRLLYIETINFVNNLRPINNNCIKTENLVLSTELIV